MGLARSCLLSLGRRLAGRERERGQSVDWGGGVGSLLRDGISVRLGRRTCVLGALYKISGCVRLRRELCRERYLLGSGEAVMPGTMLDGEKAACSISAK